MTGRMRPFAGPPAPLGFSIEDRSTDWTVYERHGRCIYAYRSGTFTLSQDQVAIPGCYADIGTAEAALTRTDEELSRLQVIANARGDHVITAADLATTYELPTPT